MNYAKAIREARETVGLSKRQLGEMCECSPSFFTHLENGARKPSVDMLEKIAYACGITVAQLVRRAEIKGAIRG